MKRFFACIALIALVAVPARAQVWQWSVPVDGVISRETNSSPRAFLWIPPGCKQVRGVVVGEHNMLEEGILQHADFRRALAAIDFAEVWVTPAPDMVFRFDKGAGDAFNTMMKELAEVSGYSELVFAPIVPMGHSAAASYPWNFAAWDPGRTLAILSVHGDAPLTNLTGSGQPNPDWGAGTIDGIPGLMVMGEYEWWDQRLLPALAYKRQHPLAPISFLADEGHGHFDFSDALVHYLGLFIQKAAKARLIDGTATLKAVYPQDGWLGSRWFKDTDTASPAPYGQYKGDSTQAFWYFDREMAEATMAYYAKAQGKKDEYIGYMQADTFLPYHPKTLARITEQFVPMDDGVTFHVRAVYTDSTRERASDEHSTGPISVTRICGPVMRIDDTTFSVRFYRMGFNNPKRSGDIWLIAASNGDDVYKSTVQQFNVRIPVSNTEGDSQHIFFPRQRDIKIGTKSVTLTASADRALPVYYYVLEGPAEVKGNQLVLTAIPPRTRFPVKVTVVAWQYGRSIEPKIRSAEPVTQTFYINR
jgi:hypothetical protein